MDVRSDLQVGKNLLSAEANVVGSGENGLAGLIALLLLTMLGGRVVRYASDTSWKSVVGAKGDWQSVGYDGSSCIRPWSLHSLEQIFPDTMAAGAGESVSPHFSAGENCRERSAARHRARRL